METIARGSEGRMGKDAYRVLSMKNDFQNRAHGRLYSVDIIAYVHHRSLVSKCNTSLANHIFADCIIHWIE